MERQIVLLELCYEHPADDHRLVRYFFLNFSNMWPAFWCNFIPDFSFVSADRPLRWKGLSENLQSFLSRILLGNCSQKQSFCFWLRYLRAFAFRNLTWTFKASRETNIAAPLRTLGAYSDATLLREQTLKVGNWFYLYIWDFDFIFALFIYTSFQNGYFASLLRIIALFTPESSSIHIEDSLPPKLESLCEQLVMPLQKIEGNRFLFSY